MESIRYAQPCPLPPRSDDNCDSFPNRHLARETAGAVDARKQGRQQFRATFERGYGLRLRLSTADRLEENNSCVRAVILWPRLIAVPPWWKQMNGCHHSVHVLYNQQGDAMRPLTFFYRI